MWIPLRLGLRNLRRRPLRTGLTFGMLAVSTTLIVFANGLNEGTYADMIRLATTTFTGQMQVQHPDYLDSPSLFETVDDPEAVLGRLRADPEVVAATPRVEVAGLLSKGKRTTGVMLTGVDPAGERKTTTLAGALKSGTWLEAPEDADSLPIVLGAGLARRLRAEIGDELTFLGQAADGSIAAELYTLVGIVESGAAQLDATMAFIRLGDAQSLLELGQRVHAVVVRLEDVARTQRVAARLEVPGEARVLPWQTLMPGLDESIRADRSGMVVFVVIIILVVVLGAANSMLMSVFERTREIGVMKALGTSPGRLVLITMAESTWLAFMGVGLGLLVGVGLNAYFGQAGIVFFEEPIEFGGVSFREAHPINNWLSTVVYPGIIFLAGVLAGLWPAIRAARLDPVQAIREG